jgi:hypothetical protein
LRRDAIDERMVATRARAGEAAATQSHGEEGRASTAGEDAAARARTKGGLRACGGVAGSHTTTSTWILDLGVVDDFSGGGLMEVKIAGDMSLVAVEVGK